ncbi:hypothetical protein BDW74DRAFT_172825 [Aspergillus multicolor]|uniref:uncharacterized protein n=1 Tax=Aspergillus multicolor TaxID=41759 RepID=UPI003CCD75BC
MIQTKRLQTLREKLPGSGPSRPSLRMKRPILAQAETKSSPARPAKQARLDIDDEESNSDDGDIGSDGQTRPLRSSSRRSQDQSSHSPERPMVIVGSTPVTPHAQRPNTSTPSPHQRAPYPISSRPPVPAVEGPPKNAQEPAQAHMKSPRSVQMQIDSIISTDPRPRPRPAAESVQMHIDSIISVKPGSATKSPAVQAQISQAMGKPSVGNHTSKAPDYAVTPKSPSNNAPGLKGQTTSSKTPLEPRMTPETQPKAPDASLTPAPIPADTSEPKSLTASSCFRYGLQYLSKYVKFSEQNDEAQTDKTALLQSEVASLRDKLNESEKRQEQLKKQLELKSEGLNSLKSLLSQFQADLNKQLEDVRADTRKVIKQQEKFWDAEDWKVSDMLNMMAMARSQGGGSAPPDI